MGWSLSLFLLYMQTCEQWLLVLIVKWYRQHLPRQPATECHSSSPTTDWSAACSAESYPSTPTSHPTYMVGMWDREQCSSKCQPFGLAGIHAHTCGIHAPHMAGQYQNTAHTRRHAQSNWTSTGLMYHTIACLELLKKVVRGLHFHLAVLGLLQSAVGIQTGCFNYFLVGHVRERQLPVAPDLPQGNSKGPPAQYIHTQGETQHPGDVLPIHHTYPACTGWLVGQHWKTSTNRVIASIAIVYCIVTSVQY